MIILDCIDKDRGLIEVNEKLNGDLTKEIKKRIDYIDPNLNVLDIGCGKKGNCIENIAKEYPSIRAVGIDPKCQSRSDLPNLQTIVRDVFELPFKNEFDIVYSTFVFFYIEGFETSYGKHMVAKAVINSSEALKQNGVALLSEINYSTKGKLDRLISQIITYHPDFLDRFKVRVKGKSKNKYLRIRRLF